ncbi:MAG TPA: alkaline phosphatase family protein [Chthoniobacterales bacterium]|jgi:phospholipase C|nr:alkaline phosphatase family protein [Chthoniobacterales bacterium]
MTKDPIEHVVLLQLENHSFDQMMGSLKAVFPQMEGVNKDKPGVNYDDKNQPFFQKETQERQVILDPHHEVDHVARQLAGNNGGFVQDFVSMFPDATAEQRQFIMGCYPLDFLPALHTLGRSFTVCDHWFASVPGPTWPNRFFALSGTSSGRTDMPDDGTHKADLFGYLEQTQPTIFDRLNDAEIDWRIYYHDLPQSLVFWRQREPQNSARYFQIEDFYRDVQKSETLKPFTYIEPRYNGEDQNDDHPPHDIMKAQQLIADVYNAIRSSEVWNSTLLVIFYDEHGGFYDHVIPPAAVPPDDCSTADCFKQLGVRVPALLISPWVEASVLSQQMDHTSFLKYLCEKWNLDPLGERAKQATSFASAICSDWDSPRTDTPTAITLTAEQSKPPDAALDEQASKQKNAHQVALIMMAHYLETQTDLNAPTVLSTAARARWFVAPFFPVLALGYLDLGLVRSAQQSVQKFLDKKKAQNSAA